MFLKLACGTFKFLAAITLVGRPAVGEAPADLIVHGGRVATVDAGFSIHETMAVRDGRVMLVGSNAEVLATRDATTLVIDLEGRLVLPGLIDSHTHPAGASMHAWDHPIPSMECIADVLGYIRSRAEVLEDGDWISVSRVFVTRLAERRCPTRAELDSAASRNPVVFGTGSDASVNSLALSLRSIFAAGGVVGGGSDHMQRIGAHRAVNPYDPFLGMATAITRRGKGVKEPVHPEESLTREQAIRLYTINNARLMFLEEGTGSLEAGKLADFIVLDRNILTCPEDEIRDTRVLQTFPGGKRVFPVEP